MARTKRNCPAGEVFHVLNRVMARLTIFEKPEDNAAFMRAVAETSKIVPLPIYAMVAMPRPSYDSNSNLNSICYVSGSASIVTAMDLNAGVLDNGSTVLGIRTLDSG